MKLQKSTLFALYAVLELASEPDRQMSTAGIAEHYGISTHHLAKVMRTVVRAGLAQSVRGAGGGYRFAGNLRRTTLHDVIVLFEPSASDLGPADAEKGAASPIAVALCDVRDEIDELATVTLKSITLKSVLKHAAKTTRLDRAGPTIDRRTAMPIGQASSPNRSRF